MKDNRCLDIENLKLSFSEGNLNDIESNKDVEEKLLNFLKENSKDIEDLSNIDSINLTTGMSHSSDTNEYFVTTDSGTKFKVSFNFSISYIELRGTLMFNPEIGYFVEDSGVRYISEVDDVVRIQLS